ncbi:FIST N-terminal domain-containing protein [Lentisphaerota bacterium WC36G]|nr:hypothetical protein LJT99_03790 [Lentisphaerae bacterium WC36]
MSKTILKKLSLVTTLSVAVATAATLTGCLTITQSQENIATAFPVKNGTVKAVSATVENSDAYKAGKTAAHRVKARLGGTEPHIIVVVDSYGKLEQKKELIDGVASVFKRDKIIGGAVYGVYSQDGAYENDGVGILAFGGDGVQIETALIPKMNATNLSMEKDLAKLTQALGNAGSTLAKKLPNAKSADFMFIMADAHSPKNQLFLDGIQKVVGDRLPITGGSNNKNNGLNYVYYRGGFYQDAAWGMTVKGNDFVVKQTGLQAKTNDDVIATAKKGAKRVSKELASAKAKPFLLSAVDCAGRMGKLDDLNDELTAIKKAVGTELTIFGNYCAGEYGVAEDKGKKTAKSVGRGWHVMFSILGQK